MHVQGGIDRFLNPILITVVGVLTWNFLTSVVSKIDSVSADNETNYRLLADKIDLVNKNLTEKVGVINDRFSAQAERLGRVEVRQDNTIDRVSSLEKRPSNTPDSSHAKDSYNR